MITISGFLPAIAEDLANYLQHQFDLDPDKITIAKDSATNGTIAIIQSDTLDKPCHSLNQKCFYIGSKPIEINAQDKHLARYEKLPLKLPVLKDQIASWLDDKEAGIHLSDALKFMPNTKAIQNETGENKCFLTEKEADLLIFLHAHAGKFFEKDTLLKEVWGYQSIDTHTLETHIYRLRAKLAELLPENKGLLTSDSGYSFTI